MADERLSSQSFPTRVTDLPRDLAGSKVPKHVSRYCAQMLRERRAAGRTGGTRDRRPRWLPPGAAGRRPRRMAGGGVEGWGVQGEGAGVGRRRGIAARPWFPAPIVGDFVSNSPSRVLIDLSCWLAGRRVAMQKQQDHFLWGVGQAESYTGLLSPLSLCLCLSGGWGWEGKGKKCRLWGKCH